MIRDRIARERCSGEPGVAGARASAGAAILIAAVAITPFSVVSADAAECADLATLALPQTKIDAAQSIPAGSYAPPYAKPLADLPAFCRVHGVVSPVPGSVIGFEVWLPQTNWNRKLEMFGNGGCSSDMSYPDMAARLKAAYVSVATDTGHIGSDPSFAIARPESIPDWGYRAVHETVERAKLLTHAFYGEPPAHNYFRGCSTGGHQALMEAQRFPIDFDGIIAGDPGNNRTHLNAGFLWQYIVNHQH